jgi:hypothetical protein
MQSVTFMDNQGQQLGTFNMDVPRAGDSVMLSGQAGSVQAVRFFLYPNGAARAAVMLTPLASTDAVSQQHYEALAKLK